MRAVLLVWLAALCACGGGHAKTKTTPKPKPGPVAKKPPAPPPPPCISDPDGVGEIAGATGSAGGVEFCVAGTAANDCFAVDVASGAYKKLSAAPEPQSAALAPDDVKVETTATEVKVCAGDDCKTVTPKVPKGADDQLVAVANTSIAVVMLGNADAGKGVAEVWDLAKNKKTATIKYASGDFKCGVPKLLGGTIYISAGVCAGPAARAGLYGAKGKKIADAGGKDFGSYSEVAVQIDGNQWAFLEENGSYIAVQDVATGKLAKTIQLAALWLPEGSADTKEQDAPAMGNPGKSALVRGGDGQLMVIAGGPATGTVGVVDLASGEVKVVRAPVCKTE